jgi:hypothetical protein
MRRLWVVAFGGLLLAFPNAMAGEDRAVELAGLRVVGPGYGRNGTELQAFHERSGTTLVLLVRAPEDRKIVAVEDSKCSMVEFRDDRGRSLLDGVHWGGFPHVSDDARHALLEVTSRTRPSQEASRLLAEGTIRVRIAASERTERIETLRLTVGSKAQIQQEVVQVMKVQQEGDGLTLVVQMNRRFAEGVRDIRFFAPSGHPIDIRGRGSFTFGTATQLEFNLETRATPESLKIELDVWQDLQDLDLGFQINAGMGLQR